MTVCCEHNPCPDRPHWRLRRFQTRPWRCPQCSAWWVTECMGAVLGDVVWYWKRAEPNGDASS